MAKISERLISNEAEEKRAFYLGQPSRGKVRDTYRLPGYPGLLLSFASDRISIFDFVLNLLVPGKGQILTAMTVLWLTEVFRDVNNHLVAYGTKIRDFLPFDLWEDSELISSGLVIHKLDMLPVECIARGYLTGGGLKTYRETGQICGNVLPPGLHDGSKITPEPIFTPTTKEEEGHDQDRDYRLVVDEFGPEIMSATMNLYCRGLLFAESRGLILADTKFEFGYLNGVLYLGDEVLTPDSSRYWDKTDYRRAAELKKSPDGFDKQPVREFGKTLRTGVMGQDGQEIVGINNLKPEIPEHVKAVHGLEMPQHVAEMCGNRYHTCFERLSDGRSLSTFQQYRNMSID